MHTFTWEFSLSSQARGMKSRASHLKSKKANVCPANLASAAKGCRSVRASWPMIGRPFRAGLPGRPPMEEESWPSTLLTPSVEVTSNVIHFLINMIKKWITLQTGSNLQFIHIRSYITVQSAATCSWSQLHQWQTNVSSIKYYLRLCLILYALVRLLFTVELDVPLVHRQVPWFRMVNHTLSNSRKIE